MAKTNQPIETRLPSDISLRVVWEYEQDVDLSHLAQWNTPEKYAGNELVVKGAKVPFDKYKEFWGNPDFHIVLRCSVQHKCPTCGAWETVDSCGNFDFMTTNDVYVGAVAAADVAGDIPEDAQLEATRDMIEEALRLLDCKKEGSK